MQKDGGWAWVIVAAAFIISFVCDGIRYSYGILYLDLLKEFGQGKGPTAWIGSIMFGLQNVSGPLVAVFINTFGCRTAIVSGALVCSIGYIIGVFVTSVYFLCLTFAILSGIGLSMMMLPLHVVIVQYFDKRRSLAMGLAFTGSGIGTIVFNPMSKWLIDVYGWRGTLLIQAGIILNCVLCGLLMRPVNNKQTEQETYNSAHIVKLDTAGCTGSSEHAKLYSLELNEIPEHSSIKLLDGRNDGSTTNFVQCRDIDNTSKLAETDVSYMQQSERKAFIDTLIKSEQTLKQRFLDFISNGMSKSWNNLKALMDVPFCVHLLSAFLVGFSYNVPFTYVPDLAVVVGHGRTKAATMMAAFGISSTVSRALSGMIADCSCVFRPYMMLVARCLIGVSTVLLPLSGDFVIMMSMCVLLGASTGFLFDNTGRYEVSFITAGVCMLLSGILVGGVVFLQWLRRRRK